jgi:hypothetical protein
MLNPGLNIGPDVVPDCSIRCMGRLVARFAIKGEVHVLLDAMENTGVGYLP